MANPGMQAIAAEVTVTDHAGGALSTVMVRRERVDVAPVDQSDSGYPAAGTENQAHIQVTRFTGADGVAAFPDANCPEDACMVRYRLRTPGFADLELEASASADMQLVMTPLSDPGEIALSRPANAWMARLDFGGDEGLRKHFLLNCAFCHQQGTEIMRAGRTPEEWLVIIDRMGTYGSRLAGDARDQVAAYLSRAYAEISATPERVPEATPWVNERGGDDLSAVTITEWVIGNEFSQMHDMLWHSNGKVYIGDNLQDRIYAVDPGTGIYKVYPIPHGPDDEIGGLMGNRFGEYFAIHEARFGSHSLAESPVDGHIFITPSLRQMLIEFAPETGEFTFHQMDGGFYPHTIRIDARDRVWFTLAVSSQVAMWDRRNKEFTLYNLPGRDWSESLKLTAVRFAAWIGDLSLVSGSVDPDRDGSGLPMPYGIDITPDGTVWVARLYANDIARIDPESGDVTMIETPFLGPRRLRSDNAGNLWMVGFQDSLIAKYDPTTEEFTTFDLPVVPAGSEVPYALNVDKSTGYVWVNGNMSDSMFRFDPASETWRVFPLPRRGSFTRDIEFVGRGAAITTNSHTPIWQAEGGLPTMIRIEPGEAPAMGEEATGEAPAMGEKATGEATAAKAEE